MRLKIDTDRHVLEIVSMFVLKDFVRDCFVAQICAKMCVRAVIGAYLRDEAMPRKILGYEYEHWNYPIPKEHAHQYGGRGGYFFKNLKVSKVASSALAEGATFEHFFQKKAAFSAVAEEATFFIASSAMAEEATFLKNIFLKTKK